MLQYKTLDFGQSITRMSLNSITRKHNYCKMSSKIRIYQSSKTKVGKKAKFVNPKMLQILKTFETIH